MATVDPVNVVGGGRRRLMQLLLLLSLLAPAALLLALYAGEVALGVGLADLPAALLHVWQGRRDSLQDAVLLLRLARAGNAFVTGALLALAGVMMQTLLRNPLADPYILGISGGAALGALAVLLWLPAFVSVWLPVVDAAAFFGALLSALVLYVFAGRDLRHGLAQQGGTSLLLLTGVMLSSVCMALVTLILSLAPDGSLRGMVFWLIGDLAGSEARVLPWLALLLGLMFALPRARAFNVLALYAGNALSVGVNASGLRRGLFICSALLTAAAVAGGGSIGFVGLVAPHACRMWLGPDHRLLLPAATICGGIFLLLADTLARVAIAPQQLPVGVVTALIGAPVFLLQLHRLHASGKGRE